MAGTPEDLKRAEAILHQDPEEETTEEGQREEVHLEADQNLPVTEREVMREVEAGTFLNEVSSPGVTPKFNNHNMVNLYLPQLSLLTS